MTQVPQDPDCYPGTHVLRNLAGAREQALLDAFEASMVAYRLALMERRPIVGPFDEVRLKATHRRLFDGVYGWAGEFRHRPGLMTKRRESGALVVYGDAMNMERELARVFRSIAGERMLAGLGVESFATRAAFFYREIDAIHPFREGNSRTLRQLFGDIAAHAGHRLDWSIIASDDVARNRLHAARDLAVLNGELADLMSLFHEALAGGAPPR